MNNNNQSSSRSTSKRVGSYAGRILQDDNSTMEQRSVAGSALSQVEKPKSVIGKNSCRKVLSSKRMKYLDDYSRRGVLSSKRMKYLDDYSEQR